MRQFDHPANLLQHHHPADTEPDHLHRRQTHWRPRDADGRPRARVQRTSHACARSGGSIALGRCSTSHFVHNILAGNLGISFNYRMPVSELYFERLPNSLQLALAATLLSFLIGIPAGLLSAVSVDGVWDQVGKIIALLGLSIPGFWLGLVLILIFSVYLEWLPTGGQGLAGATSSCRPGAGMVLRGLAVAPHPLEHAGGDASEYIEARATRRVCPTSSSPSTRSRTRWCRS